MREVVWLVINYALCIPVILLVGIFSGYHFYCVAINQTTIESWEKDRTATMIRRGRIRRVKYPYNLGFWRNVRTMLGDNVLTWCLPKGRGGREMGDGLKYPVAPGLGKLSRWRRQTRAQDRGEGETEGEQEEEIVEKGDDSYVDPQLEASVLHRLRWERWHRVQASQQHQQLGDKTLSQPT